MPPDIDHLPAVGAFARNRFSFDTCLSIRSHGYLSSLRLSHHTLLVCGKSMSAQTNGQGNTGSQNDNSLHIPSFTSITIDKQNKKRPQKPYYGTIAE